MGQNILNILHSHFIFVAFITFYASDSVPLDASNNARFDSIKQSKKEDHWEVRGERGGGGEGRVQNEYFDTWRYYGDAD